MKKSEIRKIVGAMDPRTGTQFIESLVGEGDLSAIRRMLESEIERLSNMQKFEKQVYEKGFDPPAGIDEAGRGPLAGPVVAAAVILPEDYMVCRLNDSKKVSEKRREALSDIIKRDAVAYQIASADNEAIDREGILNCVKTIMLECVKGLVPMPGYLLIDAVPLDTEISQAGIIKGDSRSVSIAAASILAKVHRDAIMRKYDEEYPEYGFSRNKGYGTSEHIEAIKKLGPVEIHRRSFIKNIV
jgi:ribonuclease HII